MFVFADSRVMRRAVGKAAMRSEWWCWVRVGREEMFIRYLCVST